MTPDQIFVILGPIAMLAWLLLIIVPARAAIVTGLVVPAMLALLYVALIVAHWGGAEGGFSTLAEVAALFANPWLLLAGWVHYLCFDLLVGTWEVQDARTRGVPHLLVVPCLVLTFLFGPAGWVLYKGLAAVHTRSKA